MDKSQHTAKYKRLLRLLRRLRKKQGLTQIDVAKKLNTYRTYVSKCEAGERRIDVIELMEFCRVYELSIHKVIRFLNKE